MNFIEALSELNVEFDDNALLAENADCHILTKRNIGDVINLLIRRRL